MKNISHSLDKRFFLISCYQKVHKNAQKCTFFQKFFFLEKVQIWKKVHFLRHVHVKWKIGFFKKVQKSAKKCTKKCTKMHKNAFFCIFEKWVFQFFTGWIPREHQKPGDLPRYYGQWRRNFFFVQKKGQKSAKSAKSEKKSGKLSVHFFSRFFKKIERFFPRHVRKK